MEGFMIEKTIPCVIYQDSYFRSERKNDYKKIPWCWQMCRIRFFYHYYDILRTRVFQRTSSMRTLIFYATWTFCIRKIVYSVSIYFCTATFPVYVHKDYKRNFFKYSREFPSQDTQYLLYVAEHRNPQIQ